MRADKMVYITINENQKHKIKHTKIYTFLKKELKNTYTLVYDHKNNNEFVIIAYEVHNKKQKKFTMKIKTTPNIFLQVFEDIYIFNGAIN